MSSSPHIVVVGDIVTDVVAVLGEPIVHASDTPASISITGGGAGANTAAWLASSGARVTLCGVLGNDEAGTARLAEMAAHGVTCAIRRTSDAPTGSVVVLAERTERSMLTDRGANLHLTPADIDAALASAPEAVHLHLSGYPLLDVASRPAAQHALFAAIARGMTTSVDAASAGPLRHVGGAEFLTWVRGTDVLFANADEALALIDREPAHGADAQAQPMPEPAELARALASWCGVAVVKLGGAGAVSYSGLPYDGSPSAGSSQPAVVSAAEVAVRDATGAGDAFAAGYLVGWLAGARGSDALAAGAALGAQAVGNIGARPPRHHAS